MRKWILIAAAVVVGVGAAGFGGLYLYITLSNRNAPPPVSLTPQTPVAANTASGGSVGAVASGGATSASTCDTAAPDGTWTVSSDGQSFAGYRVNEQLASLPARSDAVGRTTAVTGTIVISGSAVTSADFTADLTKLTSDQARRDNFIRDNGLESSSFPTSTFILTQPLSFTVPAAAGQAISVTAHGAFTLHGSKRTVDIPLQAQRTCGGLEVVGSLPVTFSDYGMSPPSIGGFVSVDDHGTMELKLELVRKA